MPETVTFSIDRSGIEMVRFAAVVGKRDRAAAAHQFLADTIACLIRTGFQLPAVRPLVVVVVLDDRYTRVTDYDCDLVLAPTAPSHVHNVLLMPDFYFIQSHGYQQLAAYVDKHDVPWDYKIDSVFWRGSTAGADKHNVRIDFVSRNHPHGDLEITRILPTHCDQIPADIPTGPPVPVRHMLRHRYLVDIDGNSSSWDGLYWKLRSSSVVLKVRSDQRQWYYHRMRPWVHYVPCTVNNFARQSQWCRRNPELCRAIAQAGQRVVKEMTYEAEVARFAVDFALRTGLPIERRIRH